MKKLFLGIMLILCNGCLASDSLENERKRSSTTDLGLVGFREAEMDFVARSNSIKKPSNVNKEKKKSSKTKKSVFAIFGGKK